MIKKSLSKTIAILVLVCCLIASSAVFLVGCSHDDSTNETTKYTIVYDSRGGAAVKNGVYETGKKLNLPTPSIGSDPKMYGFSFTGWYYDTECTKKVDRNAIDVSYAKSGVLTFYAGWTNLHNVYFDTKTSQIIDSVQYAYGATVNKADLPVPQNRVVGSAVCEFVGWALASTGELIGDSFTMGAMDTYLYAVYDTGVNTRFELTDDGYYVPTGTNGVTTQTRYRDYELKNGQIYSVDMTLPADWSEYTDDCGPVFSATAFDEKGTTFIGAPYVTMFISAPTKNNGAIEFWGDVDADGKTTSAQLIARYKLGDDLLKGTPYETKMLAYQESSEEATFTLTFRRVENGVGENATVSYYIGIDGVEYVCFTTGERPIRYSEINNIKDSVFSVKHTGSLVGLRAKTKGVKYSNIKVYNANETTISFDAGQGTVATESITKEIGASVGTLPVAEREGFDFAGWYYRDYITGAQKELSDNDIVTADMYNITVSAQWRKTGAKPYTVVFNTGIDGYTVKPVTGWYEGNAIDLPKLSYTMMQFADEWYYEAACANVVDFDNIDTTKAEIAVEGETQTLTVYAKASKKEFLEGEGTEANPYLIKTAADLAKFAEFVTAGETLSGYYLKLENDVEVASFTQIGNKTKAFSGYFDGNGKTIKGVNLEGASNLGMFAILSGATVKNLTIEGSVGATGGTNGLLAAQAYCGTLVENVTVKGTVSGGSTDNGGLIGASVKIGSGDVYIKNCVNYANVTSSGVKGTAATGGIIGANAAGLATYIENCKNYGNISTEGTFAGGMIGLLRVVSGNNNAKVSGCYNYGNINGGVQVGGIVGGSRDKIADSFTLATALINGTAAADLALDGTATTFIGAVAGRLEGGAASRTNGGLCDENGVEVTVDITLELELDGGELPAGTELPVKVAAEKAILGHLPVPVKAGYRFIGWELVVVSGEGEEQTTTYVAVTETTIFNGPAHTEKLVARYVEQVVLTIDADGGEYTGATTITLDKGSKLTEALGTPTKEGYTFLGWFNGETRITADDVYNANTTIKAHYEEQAQKSVIKFYSDETLVKSTELVVGNAIGTLPVPEAKAGYRFDGWYDLDDNKITEASTFEASEVTLNAKWVIQTVITFNAGDGTVEEATRSIDAGTAIGQLPEAATTVAGESFGGWMYNGELVTAETVFGAEVTAVTLTASFGWDGTTVSTALEGEGTETNPYVLSSGANLAYLANSVNGGEAYSGKYFVLAKNINLNFKAWTPIGKATTTPFSGIINGNNNVISGINVEGDNYLGMFGVLYGATIKNLTVDGTVVGNKDTVGILAGQIQSGTTIETIIIRGRVTSKSSANTATGGVGGIAGNTVAKGDGAINIKDCINYAEINAPFTGSNMAGGIVGATNSQLIVIENCKNYGTINATGTFAGGIVGLFRVCKVDTKVTGCYNFGDINGNLQIGGIVGGNRYVVENCYVLATAKIKGTEAKDLTLDSNASPFVAAIAGRMEGAGAKRTGGGLCDAQGNVIE
mgnify:FL=1